ncbi:MAG: MFS transporter [Oligoflexia bacterium]|nr:MFS transporter [Oligoflexia bacterium]
MSRKWWVLASVACGTFMATLDSSIVNIALPTLTKELGADLYRIKWVVIVYLFVVTVLLLPFGRLSDEYGRRRIFTAGYLVFVLGSALCGISPDLGWLVLSRGLQAIGASMLMVNGPAIITAVFPATERGAALGTLAMVVSAGLISGPSIGGFLISQLGWRSIFWVNVPIGLAGAALVYRNVTRDPSPRSRAPFDWVGAFLQTILLTSFIMLFDPPHISVSGSEPIVLSRWLIGLVTLVFAGFFLKLESDAKAPLFDLKLLRNRTFWTGNLASFLLFVSFSSVSVLMPFFLEEIMGFPPHRAGLFMTAIPLMIFVVAPISGRLSDRLGGQELSFAGALIGALGLLAMAGAFGPGIHKEVGNSGILLALSCIGLAMGLFQSPNNNSIMGSVPPSKLGVASALLATVRNLGLVTGTGLATGLFTWRMEETGDFVRALHLALLVGGVLSLGAMIASLGKERGPLKAPMGNPEA